MDGAIKNYIVNYEIQSSGNASAALGTLARQATTASANVDQLVKSISNVNQFLKKFTANESLKNIWNITPTVNLERAESQLRTLEETAQQSAQRIQSMMSRALSGVSGGKSGLYTAGDKAAIQERMKQLEKEYNQATRGLSKISSKDAKGAKTGVTDEAVRLRQEWRNQKKLLDNIAKVEKAAEKPGATTNLTSLLNRANDIKNVATRIDNLTKSVNKFGTVEGGRNIRIDANIAPAMRKIQNLLDSVRSAYAAINIGVTDKPIGKKGSYFTADGKLSKLGTENTAAATKATITKATQAAKDSLAAVQTGLATNIKNLQERANATPIRLRTIINGSDAGFQLQQSITRLQELANSRPVSVAVRIAANAVNNAISQANTGAKGKGTSTLKPIELGVKLVGTGLSAQMQEITAKAREYASKAKVSIKVGAQPGELSKGIKNVVSQAQKLAPAKTGIKIKANLELNTQALSTQLSKIISQLQAEADKKPINIKSTLNGNNLLSQLNTTIKSLEKAVSKLTTARASGTTTGTRATGSTPIRERAATRGGSTVIAAPSTERLATNTRALQSGPDYYSRVRALWYPFTGNTSFGARTPMMVDMAKGMGAMFAVGGAMSAVGSSLRQAVQYQNQMRTTKAILENGTETYTPEGFANMEKTVRDVGKKTKFTAPDVANAARFMAMAGLDIPAINSAIRPIADVALIGDTDLGATADKLTNVMTTFGIAPEKMRDVADIMTSTFTRTNTDMMMLAESAKYAGGIANLYGGNFQNNFADIMAMFGVLGNAGIQASSAGTTIRMMYQNLMQPNKKQAAALKKYGIFTRDTNGQPLEMSDIIHQLHAKIPQNQMADAIGTMFRITAQPGAATLASHVDTLDRIMAANRSAAGTNISGQIADEKKNTIAGLWAQVTSTFTEGVVQAFENREGGWAGMLANLRDYLAKPETVKMISRIIDLVETLARTMAWFADIWAKAYSAAPKLIGAWMHLQLVFTQIGYLATPIVSLIGVFSTLRRILFGVSAAGTAANASLVRNAVAGGAVGLGSLYGLAPAATMTAAQFAQRHTTRFLATEGTMAALGTMAGRQQYASRMAPLRAAQASFSSRAVTAPRWENALILGSMAGLAQGRMDELRSGQQSRLKELRRPLQKANPELMARYNRMYPHQYLGRQFNAGRALGTLSLAGMFGGIKSAFLSLMGGLAKAIGLLVSPIGLVSGAIGILGFMAIKAYKDIKGRKDELAKADEYGKWVNEANKNLQNDYLNASIEAGGFAPIQVGYAKKNNETNAQLSLGDNATVNGVLNDTKYLTGSEIVKKFTNNSDIYVPQDELNDFYRNNADYVTTSSYQGHGYVETSTINQTAIENARKLGVIGQWGKLATEQEDVKEAEKDLQKAIYSGNQQQIDNILNAYKPSSLLRMYGLGSAEKIRDITDPTKYYEWQNAQYQALQNMVNAYLGPSQYYKTAFSQLKDFKNSGKDERSRFDALSLVQNLVRAVPVEFNNTRGAITLDKMGRIDWMALANSVNNGIPFTIGQQMDILKDTYDTIYNDPNIKNVQSVIELLDRYLPQIANERNPYNGMTFGLWPEDNTWPLSNGGVVKNETVDVPLSPKPTSLNIPSVFDSPLLKTPQQNDIIRIAENTPGGYLTAPSIYKEKYPDRFPNNNVNTKKGGTNTGSKTGITPTPSSSKKSQKDYASTYSRNAARPTQVIINIENLARFDRTAIAQGAEERDIVAQIESKIAEAVMMLSSTALNEASSLISQGVS